MSAVLLYQQLLNDIFVSAVHTQLCHVINKKKNANNGEFSIVVH